jgi:hypothetical protein
MTPRDPRLADEAFLRLAALRAKHRQAHPPGRVVVLRIRYDGTVDEPPQWGDTYTIALPEKAPSVESWYQATSRFREQLQQPRGEEEGYRL